MGIENRRNDTRPFVYSRTVKEAVRTIMDGMQDIQHRAGEVVYPDYLSRKDIRNVLELVRKQSGGLVLRVREFSPIRLEEGMGTVISIREKGRR